MFAILALSALALIIEAAWSYRSARRALAARLAREFAGILDAIDNVVGSDGDAAVTKGDAFSLNGALHPASPTIADASWRLLLGSRRTATFEAFLEAARALSGFDGERGALFSTVSESPRTAFIASARHVTALGDAALLSLRDILSHRRGHNQTIRA